MKIIVVSSTFPPRRFGGITAVSYNLAKSLVKRGHDVTVYTTDISDKYSRIPDIKGVKHIDGINVLYFKNLSNSLASNRFYLPVGFVRMVKKELKNFDIIHLHDFRSFQTIAVHHYAKKYGIPYVLQAHGSLTAFLQKGMLKKIFDRLWGYRILKDAAKVIAVTQMEVEQYKSMGVSEDKIEIVPNGIDLTEFDNLPERGEFRKKYGLDSNRRVILYLGRIHKTKGIDLLVKAFARLSNDFSDTKLAIAGPDDGYLPALKKLVADLEISDKVLFIGPLYGKEKTSAYADADVFVNPRPDEIFGVVFIEALACGTPVICSTGCGIADVIDGQVGLAVPYNEEQLSSAILRMLSDAKLRQEFGDSGKSLVREQFNWDNIAGQVEDIYQSVVTSNTGGIV